MVARARDAVKHRTVPYSKELSGPKCQMCQDLEILDYSEKISGLRMLSKCRGWLKNSH